MMNTRILLLAAGVAALSSCSSVYKSGQTPDDVYFSPARQQEEYVEVRQKNEDRYQTYEEYQDNYRNDRFLRLSMRNRYMLGMYNDYDFYDWRYNTYAYNYNSPWNNYWAWNNFYNPYCRPVIFVNPKIIYNTAPISRPVAFNVNSYKPIRNAPRSYNGTYYNSGQRYNNSNNSGLGNSLIKAFSGSSNNSNSYTPSNNTSTPDRSYTPSSSSSSSSSSSGGGGGGGVSRPTRGN